MKTKLIALSKWRSVRFAFIGILNTMIDFGILNFGVSVLGLPRVPATIISASVAMVFRFTANRKFVFKSDGDHRSQMVKFITVTLAGLYILQTVIIILLTEWFTWPLETATSMIHAIGPLDALSQDFIFTNGSKVVATIASMIWNYTLYNKLVFNAETPTKKEGNNGKQEA